MKTQKIDNEELLNRLKTKFGEDTPIFMSEIQEEWKEYSDRRIFELINLMVESNKIYKAIKGTYFFKTIEKPWNLPPVLDKDKIIYKKYISNNNERIGYYSGMVIENMLGLTSQVPNVSIVVSNRETSNKRILIIGKTKYIIKKPKTKVDETNYKIFQLLEVFNKAQIKIDSFQMERIKEYFGNNNDREFIEVSAKLFPKRTLYNLRKEGVLNEITS